jgi:hypothetical protein
MIGGIGILVALVYLVTLFIGIMKSAIDTSKEKKSQNKKPTKSKKTTNNDSKEPHPEYPEEPDYPDPEDADLIEWNLDR